MALRVFLAQVPRNQLAICYHCTHNALRYVNPPAFAETDSGTGAGVEGAEASALWPGLDEVPWDKVLNDLGAAVILTKGRRRR